MCQGASALSLNETLRRMALAIDCMGVQWVRYTIMVSLPLAPPGLCLLPWASQLGADVATEPCGRALQDARITGDGVLYKETPTFAQNPTRLAILDAAVQLAAQKGVYIEVCACGWHGSLVCLITAASGSRLLAT